MSLQSASLALYSTQQKLISKIEELRSDLSRQGCDDEGNSDALGEAAVTFEAATARVKRTSEILATLQKRLITLESRLQSEVD